jgi:hypothetical protein
MSRATRTKARDAAPDLLGDVAEKVEPKTAKRSGRLRISPRRSRSRTSLRFARQEPPGADRRQSPLLAPLRDRRPARRPREGQDAHRGPEGVDERAGSRRVLRGLYRDEGVAARYPARREARSGNDEERPARRDRPLRDLREHHGLRRAEAARARLLDDRSSRRRSGRDRHRRARLSLLRRADAVREARLHGAVRLPGAERSDRRQVSAAGRRLRRQVRHALRRDRAARHREPRAGGQGRPRRKKQTRKPADGEQISAAEIEKLRKAIEFCGATEEEFCTFYKLEKIEDLPAKMLPEAMDACRRRAEGNEKEAKGAKQ